MCEHPNQKLVTTKTKMYPVSIHQVDSLDRKYIDILINNISTQLQIDTAADVTVISNNLCNELALNFNPTIIQPNNASGNVLSLIGEINCDITFNQRTLRSTIYVSNNENVNVFGNDLLKKFDLWKMPIDDFCTEKQIHQVIQRNDYATFLKTNFPSCFETSLGKYKQSKVHLQLKNDAKPPFYKYRPVPFAIQPK